MPQEPAPSGLAPCTHISLDVSLPQYRKVYAWPLWSSGARKDRLEYLPPVAAAGRVPELLEDIGVHLVLLDLPASRVQHDRLAEAEPWRISESESDNEAPLDAEVVVTGMTGVLLLLPEEVTVTLVSGDQSIRLGGGSEGLDVLAVDLS